MPLCWKHVVPAVSSPSQFDDPSIIRTVGYPTWRLHFPASDTLCFQPFDSAGRISKVLAEPSGVTQLRRTSSVFNLLSCSNSEFRGSTGWFPPCCLGIWPIPTTLYICLELSFDRQMALGRSWRTIRPPNPWLRSLLWIPRGRYQLLQASHGSGRQSGIRAPLQQIGCTQRLPSRVS